MAPLSLGLLQTTDRDVICGRRDHVMDNLTQVQHDDPHDSSLPEGAVLLNSASEAGNWHLVRDVISDADVSPSGIRQSFLLQKLESATVDHHLVRDILKEIFSSEASVRTMKSIAQDVLIKAAHCDNWEFLIDFLLTTESLFDDETSLLSVVRLMASSQMLQANPFLHMDVFSALWKHANQKIIDSKDNGVQNTLVQMAAELNMWSRVCDLLVTKPDLNLLDREGLSVLHRLVMCPDSRFDSLLPVVLENGADVHIKTKKGDTILHLTAKHQKITTSLPPLHLPDSKDQDKREQAKTKILEEYRSQCAESKRQLLAKLISSCQNLDDQDDLGNTAMIVAAKTDNWEFMKLLLEHGARADIVDLYQRSVLHILATKQTFTDALACRNLVALCLSRGAEVNSRDVYGNSVLHLTVQSRHWILFELLIDCGAEPGHIFLPRYFVSSGLHSVTHGCESAELDTLISLLELGLVSRQNHDEDEDDDEDLASPTRLAVETKNIPALKILIECDVSCNSELRALNADIKHTCTDTLNIFSINTKEAARTQQSLRLDNVHPLFLSQASRN
ncbi:hypothetical protein C0Q70_12229 [Pomacea canaliculata]|uniref:Uncharacterized protein n=1 Tax=Pomacea canaliculata TaxID=400727 RepID=A0A2T7P101_POMCA|nr:hypothetical protein C0Q70_12229 [Pomacea canaliculata]